MKIPTKHGAPIYLSERRDKGIAIIQGKSRIWLSEDEAKNLRQAFDEMIGATAPRKRYRMA